MVWRQEHPEQKGLYAYKMYGRFDDVTAYEFLEVQVSKPVVLKIWKVATHKTIKNKYENMYPHSTIIHVLAIQKEV